MLVICVYEWLRVVVPNKQTNSHVRCRVTLRQRTHKTHGPLRQKAQGCAVVCCRRIERLFCINIERETTLCNSDAVLLQGTNIAAGKCRGVVIGTGLNTEIGESALVPAPSDPLLIRYVSHFQCNVSDPRVVGAQLSRRVVRFSSRTIDYVAVTSVYM